MSSGIVTIKSDLAEDEKRELLAFLELPRNIFILEDDEERISAFKELLHKHNLTIVSSGEEAFLFLSEGRDWDIFFLDHDPTPEHIDIAIKTDDAASYAEHFEDYDGPLTGFDIICFLSELPNYRGLPVIIHSMNPVGGMMMKKVDENSIRVPFAILKNVMKELS